MKTAKEAYWESIKGINIKENERIVIESKDLGYCCLFAKDILERADKEELIKVVLESGNKDWINAFIEDIEFDKEKFVNYILFI